MTKKEALDMVATKWWKKATPEQIVSFQLWESRLCMDFDAFHKAVETCLGRGVFTHEFAFPELLRKEFLKERERPSLEEIIKLLPKDKTMLVLALTEGEKTDEQST